ncbi:chaperone protein DnaJ [Benincasa hispida]|uniref:chaperone protein DnaJ n=1 Tax=Benincasa hispida TaxID=102211 RepID=UPI0019017973|nr:chaperone protein DnaJ [Benincasa hispida]
MPPNGIRSPCNANLPASKFRLVSLFPIRNVLNFPIPPSPYFGSSSHYSGFSRLVGPLRRRDFQTRSRLTFVSCGAAATRGTATDHYSTLNVSRNATLQDIKNSYKKLARKYHPDVNKDPGSEDRFKEISAAYEVLSDDEKRSLYDQFGEAALQGDYGVMSRGSRGVNPFEIFDAFFGGSDGLFGERDGIGGINLNQRSGNIQNLDIYYDLHLSFEESVFGGEQAIQFSCFETCEICDGTGAKSNNCMKLCADCHGRGGVVKTQRTPFGMMSQVSICSECGGDGKIITELCRSCGGSGRMQSIRKMNLVIPPGVSDGATMKIQGEGSSDKKRRMTGNLYIRLRIDEKHGIWRDGIHLYSNISIDYTEAILGTIVRVETVEGLKDLQIPAGVQPGDRVRLPCLGIPDINKPSVRGDHLFIVNVQIPKRISDSERTKIKELALLKASNMNDEVYTHGMPQGTFDKCTHENQGNLASSQAIKRNTSIWSSIKHFIGKRQPREGFASIGVEISKPPCWRHLKLHSSYTDSLITVLIVTSLFLVGRNYFWTLVRGKYH